MIKLVKRFFIFFITIFIVIIFIKKDYFSDKLKYLILSYSNYADMVLNEVYITGRKHEKKDDIIEALNINIGDPVFSFDLEALRKRINNLAWVNYSKVHLRPLGQLDIVLSEFLIPHGLLLLILLASLLMKEKLYSLNGIVRLFQQSNY